VSVYHPERIGRSDSSMRTGLDLMLHLSDQARATRDRVRRCNRA
jgi:hypothetical protein